MDADRRARLARYCTTPRAPDDPVTLPMQLDHPGTRADYGNPFRERYGRWLADPIHARFGDVTDRLPCPTVVKSRVALDPHGVLLPLNRRRHWAYPPATVAAVDRPFSRKKMAVVWRGATTGRSDQFADHPRTQLVRRWHGKAAVGIDVAYSAIVQGKAECAPWLGPKLTLAKQLEFALVVAVEGNDVASNLKWILASKSAPVMPPPRYESWLLETRLEPFVHYVPVRPDLADLDAALGWCRRNPHEVEAIALNGQRYIAPFFDDGKEQVLEAAVLERYLGRNLFAEPQAVPRPPAQPIRTRKRVRHR